MITQLKTLGLTDKEARVYLAALELGTSSVQKIARKAGVNRATTYVMIDMLTQKGLVTSYKQDKKTYYAATHPAQLLRLLEQKKVDLKEKEKELKKDLLPELLSIHNIAGNKPKVRFFEGEKGLEAIRNDIVESKPKIIIEFINLDAAYENYPPCKNDHRHKMNKKLGNIKRKIIYYSEKPENKLKNKGNRKTRHISKKDLGFEFPGEIVLYNNKIVLALFNQEQKIGVMVENKELYQTFKALFKIAWDLLKEKQD